MAEFLYAVPVAVSLDDASGVIPEGFLNAFIANRHLTADITITFASGPTGAATSFVLLAGEQFILESVGKPYGAITVDASSSAAVIVYTLT